MFLLRLTILALSFSLFLCNSILSFAGSFDEFAVDDINCRLFHNNLETPTPKLSLLAFRRVYTVVNVVIIVVVLLNIVVYKLRQLQEANLGENLNESSSLWSGKLCRRFSLAEILLATNDFDNSLVIGKGGFGNVYAGVIDNGGCTVAVKRLNTSSGQGAPQFRAELELLPKFRHCNIISLIGYCDSFGEMILVYEYMVNGTLANYCHQLGKNGNNCSASWVQRLNMCIATARGLNYLHTGTSVHEIVIHRDVKSSNILFDKNWIAKISDFGLSRISPKDNRVSTGIIEKFGYMDQDGVSTQIKGTFGYLDPHYFLTGKLTSKIDVYSFGVVLFEVLSGRRAVEATVDEAQRGLATWATHCIKEGTIDQIIDPNLRVQILPNSLSTFVQIANQCLHNSPKTRPTMAEVVVQLQLALALQERGGAPVLEEGVSIAGQTCDRKEPRDSLGPQEVKITDNVEHRDKKIDGFINTNNLQTFVKPAKRIKVTQKARIFFSFTAKSISGIFQQLRPSEQIVTTNLKRFKLAELKIATHNFSPDMQLGKGYFRRVFIGLLKEKTYTPSKTGVGMTVAVKKFIVNSPQSFEVWKSEVQLFGKFNHPNLVRLLGYCLEDKELFIVYEYMQKGSLDKYLFKKGENPLPWDTRLKISIGAARGLCFLHKTENGVIHRKVKTSNILLDGDFNAKLSDFGLAKSGCVEEHTGLTASIAGAYGYLAPEYIATGFWYSKSDVYCFGVVLLEILTGQHVKDEFWHNEEDDYDDDLVEWAKVFLPNKLELKNLIDPRLESDYPLEGAFQLASVILKCLETFPKDRPSIEQVLESLNLIKNEIDRSIDIGMDPSLKEVDTMKHEFKVYLHHIPEFMRQFLADIEDVKADGNCGYRCIASHMGWYDDAQNWKFVRTNLIADLERFKDKYDAAFGSWFYVDLRFVLNCYDSPCDLKYWMVMPDMGYVIASAYNCVVVLISNAQCLTFLPHAEPPSERSIARVLPIAFIQNNHFIKVSLKDDAPIPPIASKWATLRTEEAGNWINNYVDKIARFMKIVPQDVSTKDFPITLKEVETKDFPITLKEVETKKHEFKAYLHYIPKFMHPFLDDIEDVKADGNCGYRCIASHMGWYDDAQNWKLVRANLIADLERFKDKYEAAFGSWFYVDLRFALDCYDSPCDLKYWMVMPDMGYVIASAYNCVVVLISNAQCLTFLPHTKPPSEGSVLRVLPIAFIQNSHFIKVSLKDDAPIPPIASKWVTLRTQEASVWMNKCVDKIVRFMEMVPQDVSTKDFPITLKEVDMKHEFKVYLHYIPEFMRPFLADIEDVKADGNCGYRCIASHMGWYADTHNWKLVRANLIADLERFKDKYNTAFGSWFYADLRFALDCYDSPCDLKHSMVMPDMGYIIASAYNCAVVLISNAQCLTFLPHAKPPSERSIPRILPIAFIQNNHFIKVSLKVSAPIPPIASKWAKLRTEEASVWMNNYVDKIARFRKMYQQEINHF